MEDTMVQEQPGFFGRLSGWLSRSDTIQEEEATMPTTELRTPLQVRAAARYTVTVRRQITCFDDALAAALGIRRGEQQILNLVDCDSAIRQKIVDFMSGVNFAQEGTWEEIAQHVYLIAPANAYVETAPPTPRASAIRN